jgi:hypothetical protein
MSPGVLRLSYYAPGCSSFAVAPWRFLLMSVTPWRVGANLQRREIEDQVTNAPGMDFRPVRHDRPDRHGTWEGSVIFC